MAAMTASGRTITFGCASAFLACLSVLGFVLAFTIDPTAISMGLGAGTGARPPV
jgi:4-hydroxybenzoate polyprenyltransferase